MAMKNFNKKNINNAPKSDNKVVDMAQEAERIKGSFTTEKDNADTHTPSPFYAYKIWTEEYVYQEDIDFINYLKDAADFIPHRGEPTAWVSITWNDLLIKLNHWTRLQDAISLDDGSRQINFIKDFKIYNYTYKKGTILNGDNCLNIIEGLSLMIHTTGNMDANHFMTQIRVKNHFDPLVQIYDNIKKRHEANVKKNSPFVNKDLVDDLVRHYMLWNPETSSLQYHLAYSNLVRMIKQVYISIMNSKTKTLADYTKISQAYFLTGYQGAGKTSLIKELFFGSLSDFTSFDDTMRPQLRSKSLIYFSDEFSAINSKKLIGKWKADVSATTLTANIKYVVDSKQFYARSTWVAATNETAFITDTTSDGSNRRVLLIPFHTTGNASKFEDNIEHFWSERSDSFDDAHFYDTKDYFAELQYAVLFTDKYDSINVRLSKDKIDKQRNQTLLQSNQHQSAARRVINEFMGGYVRVAEGDWRTALKKQREKVLLTAARTTEEENIRRVEEYAKQQGKDLQSYQGKELTDYNYVAEDDYTVQHDDSERVIPVSDLPCIYLTDLIFLLKLDKTKYYEQEITDSMAMLGYEPKKLHSARVFVKKEA